MVTIVENWATVEGRVHSWQPQEGGAAGIIELLVERIAEVERAGGGPYPNFAAGREGTVLSIRVPEGAAQARRLAVGQRVRIQVRRGRSDEFFAHPEHIVIL